MAAQEGHVDVVRTLLSKGANQQCTTEVTIDQTETFIKFKYSQLSLRWTSSGPAPNVRLREVSVL